MNLLGFKFTKMDIERKKELDKKTTIKNSIKIENIEKEKLEIPIKTGVPLKYSFSFISEYQPNAGKIELLGEIIYLEKETKAKEILKEWDKDKKIEEGIQQNLFRLIINKCKIEVMILTKDVPLPHPLIMPPQKESPSKYIG